MRQRHARAMIRVARKRYIRRRLRLFNALYGAGWAHPKPGRYSKWNGACSCSLCKAAKFRDRRRTTYQRMDRAETAAW